MTISAEQPDSPLGWDLVNDLGALPEQEDIIVDYLLDRLRRGEIYTWVGSLLLVLNPCNQIPGREIYGVGKMKEYECISDISQEELSPHIFAVAAKAHYRLTQKLGRDNQVIVISGATGTGKTFNAFKCLEYLNVISKKTASLCQGEYAHQILQQITDACRLISAFTTACTERNEVSSRHGQLVQLRYNGNFVSGATIHSFLLERSRVTKGSSNFQVFHQMMSGMPDAELAGLRLSRNQGYNLFEDIDSNKKHYHRTCFQETLKAFYSLGLKSDEREGIFQVLALIIHAGNIEFIQNGESCQIDLTNSKSGEALRNFSWLSSLSEEAISQLLTTILINPQSAWRKHTVCHRNLMTVDACRSRLHSVIRHLYDLLFQWILARTNGSLSGSPSGAGSFPEWLGILDIFGFESFRLNGIEQLCVNYSNEKMQQYFMQTYLESSRKELREEGFLKEEGPLDVIDLYEKRLHLLEEGLFVTLNDASQSLIPVDSSKMAHLLCTSSLNEGRKFLRESNGYFIIEHYSGPVSYSIKDLLSKNSDKVPGEISETFNASGNNFLRSLFDTNLSEEKGAVKSCARKKTMLAKLKYSMNTLIKELSKCDLHYVRCVKPRRMDDNNWDKEDFKRELASTGIFDALPLAKCKYPIRLTYKEFCTRYVKHYPGEENREMGIDTLKEICKNVLESVIPRRKLSQSVYCGKRLLFLAESIFLKLEHSRRNYRIRCANRIQLFWIRHRKGRLSDSSKYISPFHRKVGHEDVPAADKSEKAELKADPTPTGSPPPPPSSEAIDSFLDANAPNAKSNSFLSQGDSLQPSHWKNDKLPVHSELEASSKTRASSNEELCLFSSSDKEAHHAEHWQMKFPNMNFNGIPQLKDQFVIDCLTNITKRMSTGNGCHVSTTDVSSSSIMANRSPAMERNKQKYVLRYDKEQSLYTIQLDTYTLFYKNRILSKRRLSEIPVSDQARTTKFLIQPAVLPRAEIPQGLQDCL